MRKTVYSCDICREATEITALRGLYFSGMKKFQLTDPAATDGIHICNGCLDQLREQLSPQPDVEYSTAACAR